MAIMRDKCFKVILMGAVVALAWDAAQAGPCWVENGDAGSTPATAQAASTGSGSLKCIVGAVSLGNTAAIDEEDVYLIQVCEPTTFRAITIPPGSASFDTQLFLFDAQGLGLLGNNDAMPGTQGSDLPFESNDGSGSVLVQPGRYYLAISGSGRFPVSSTGPIFQFATPNEVSGPDGPGRFQPLSGWMGTGPIGSYLIMLEGSEYVDKVCVPALTPSGLAVLAAGLTVAGVVLARRRTKSIVS